MSQADRRHQRIELDAPQVQALLGSIDPALRLRRSTWISRGLSSTNYRIECERGPDLQLRLCAGGAEVCEKEAAVLTHCAGEFPLPRFLGAGPGAEPPFLLAEWVQGNPLDEVLASPQLVDADGLGAAVGEVLHRIHGRGFQSEGDLGRDLRVIPWGELFPWFDSAKPAHPQFMRHFLYQDACVERLGSALVEQLWARLQQGSESMRGDPLPTVLVHSDFNPKNLLVERQHENWRVSAVLDWEFALAGDPLMDVGNMLRHRDEMPKAFVHGFIEAYEARGYWLPADWLALSQFVDLCSSIECLGSKHDRPGVHEMAKRRLKAFLRED